MLSIGMLYIVIPSVVALALERRSLSSGLNLLKIFGFTKIRLTHLLLDLQRKKDNLAKKVETAFVASFCLFFEK